MSPSPGPVRLFTAVARTTRALAWTTVPAAALFVVLGPLTPQAVEDVPAGARTEREPGLAERSAVKTEAPSARPITPARELAPPSERDTPRANATTSDDGSTLYTFELTVLDGDDLPLPGAIVYLAPADGVFDVIGWTDARGRLRVQWRAPRESLRIAYGAEHPEHGASNVKVAELTAMPYSAAIQLRAAVSTHARESAEAPRSSWRDVKHSPARFDAEGLLHFAAPLVDVPGERLASPVNWTVATAPEVGMGMVAADGVTVRGVVTDARGTPQPFAPVRAFVGGHATGLATWTRADGTFELGALPARGVKLALGGGDLGRGEIELGNAGPEIGALRTALQRGREIALQLVDRDGSALAHWKVELTSAAGGTAWADVAWTDGEGKLRVPNVPPSLLRLDAFAPGAEDLVPAASLRALRAGPERVVAFDVRAGERAGLALRVVDDAGRPCADAQVLVTPVDGDRAALIGFDARTQSFRSCVLPPGRYRLALRRAGDVAIEWPGALALEDGVELDLGAFALEPPGLLCVDAGNATLAYDLARVETSGAVWIASFRAHGRWPLELPAGRYVLTASAGSTRRTYTVDVFARRTRVLAVDVR